MSEMHVYGGDDALLEKRPVLAAMRRGFAGRCPNCGEGRLFAAFTKTVDSCDVCGEEIHHHRADDFPAYVNIFIVGHIVVAGFAIVERVTDWSPWLHLAIWLPLTLVMAIVMLQPIKGAIVGLQWANRMHGFGGEEDLPADPHFNPEHHD